MSRVLFFWQVICWMTSIPFYDLLSSHVGVILASTPYVIVVRFDVLLFMRKFD